jgi:hypothetical protein
LIEDVRLHMVVVMIVSVAEVSLRCSQVDIVVLFLRVGLSLLALRCMAEGSRSSLCRGTVTVSSVTDGGGRTDART